MRCDDLYIDSTGVWYPPRVAVTDAIAAGWYDETLRERTGIHSIATSDEPAPELAIRAGRTALERSALSPGTVPLLLYATAYYQGIDCWNAASYVQDSTIGGGSAMSVEVRQLSNGGMAAIELAAGFLAADRSRQAVLLVTADCFVRPGFDRWRADADVVWGDAGTALVLSAARGFARVRSLASRSDPGLAGLYRGREPFRPAPSPDAMPIDFERRQREFFELMPVRDVIRRTSDGLRAVVDQALTDADTSLDSVAHVVVPLLGRRLLGRRVLEPLKLHPARTTAELGYAVGHLGAGDQYAGLDHLLARAVLRSGDLVLLVGLGSGYAWTCAVIEVERVPGWSCGSVGSQYDGDAFPDSPLHLADRGHVGA